MSSCTDQFEFKVERIYYIVVGNMNSIFSEGLMNVIYDLYLELLQKVYGKHLIYDQTRYLTLRFQWLHHKRDPDIFFSRNVFVPCQSRCLNILATSYEIQATHIPKSTGCMHSKSV